VTAVRCASTPVAAPASPLPTDLPFAFRDPGAGAPPPAADPRDEKVLAAAVSALRRGDAAAAEKALAGRKRKGAEEPPALQLVPVYVALLKGERDEARDTLAALTSAHAGWIAAIEAEADLAAAEGRAPEALERYQALRRLAPSDPRARARTEDLRREVATAKREEAESALRSGNLEAARRAANALLQLEPASASGPLLLSRAATASGKDEDAWTWAQEARKRAPSDPAVAAFAAEAAARAGRWADAADLYEGIAATDPTFVPKAEDARIEFKVRNLPEAARQAAESTRVTRAQMASLLWWTIPEFRDAPVPPGVEIAVDVVDRPDRVALVRSIGLGFFGVSPETHQVGAEVPLARREMGALLRRVALLAGRGRIPGGCLSAEVPSATALSECGILHDTPSRDVTGREALRALEKSARLGREGGTR
jgi:tetratricopeptide (TPR) repeat protein